MPPLAPVNHVIKFRQRWTVGIDSDALTHHYVEYAGGPPSPADMATLAAGYQGAITAHFLGSIPTTTLVDECFAEDLTSALGSTGTGGAPTAGTNPNPPGPGGLATNVQSLILRRYRGGKPRCEWPVGTASDLTTPQTWKGSYLSGFATLHAAFVSAVLALTSGTTTLVNFVNVSYFSGFTPVTNPVTGRTRDVPKPRVGGPITDLVQSFFVHPNVGTVRRRN